MNRNILSRLLFWLVPLVVVLLWLLNVLKVESFEWFNAGYAVLMIGLFWGIIYLFKGIFQKNIAPLKNLNILIAIGLFVVAFIFGVLEIVNVPTEVIAPIIVILILLVPLFSVLGNKGKKWDSGDNQNVGYKNYYQRKEEQEKKALMDNQDKKK